MIIVIVDIEKEFLEYFILLLITCSLEFCFLGNSKCSNSIMIFILIISWYYNNSINNMLRIILIVV